VNGGGIDTEEPGGLPERKRVELYGVGFKGHGTGDSFRPPTY
jgi:hypothetical protein